MGLVDDLIARLTRRGGVVLVLGGGGARGLAHLGVLDVLERAKVPVAGVAGTSAGALVGAMWLALGSVQAVMQRWREFLATGLLKGLPDNPLSDAVSSRDSTLLTYARRLKRSAVVALALGRRSLMDPAELDKGLEFLLPEVTVHNLRLPFAAVAVDFTTGRPVSLRGGPLRTVVAASCSIPGVLPPYRLGARYLIDGGTVADVPVHQARELARRPVIAVDVSESLALDEGDTITMPRAIVRGATMTSRALLATVLRAADVTVRPDVGEFHWAEFGRFDELVAAGRAATVPVVGRIQELARP
jgi:NTE family protein